MPTEVVKALVPTAVAATLLAKEFAGTSLATDGTLFTVVISGVGYSEALARIRAWMGRSQISPVLVSDGATEEELLGLPRRRRSGSTETARS